MTSSPRDAIATTPGAFFCSTASRSTKSIEFPGFVPLPAASVRITIPASAAAASKPRRTAPRTAFILFIPALSVTLSCSRITIIKASASYFACVSPATTAATLSRISFHPSNWPLSIAFFMVSFPMKVSFVWPFPRSSKMVTLYAPSTASCSIPSCAGSILFPFESAKYIEETIFSCRTISWYSPPFQPSCPSGVLMQKRNFPPTRKSILQKGAVQPFGPHHCITYFGSVHAFQTNSRGASKTLVTTIRSVLFAVSFVISGLRLFFHLLHDHFQLVETLFPELAIANRPVADGLDRLRPERANALSSTLRLDHNPRPHQVGNMF